MAELRYTAAMVMMAVLLLFFIYMAGRMFGAGLYKSLIKKWLNKED